MAKRTGSTHQPLKERPAPLFTVAQYAGGNGLKSDIAEPPRTRSEWMEHYRMWETCRVIDHEYGGWKRKENRHMDLTFIEYIGMECPEEE